MDDLVTCSVSAQGIASPGGLVVSGNLAADGGPLFKCADRCPSIGCQVHAPCHPSVPCLMLWHQLGWVCSADALLIAGHPVLFAVVERPATRAAACQM